MNCPRCGYADAAEPSCPRCGVIFARLKAESARPAPPPSAPLEPPPGPGRRAGRLLLELAAVAGAVGIAVWLLRQPPPSAHEPRVIPTLPPLASLPAETEIVVDRPPIVLDSPRPRSSAPPPIQPAGIDPEDARIATALAEQLRARQPVNVRDIEAAEALALRHPREKPLQNLVGELLLAAALQEQTQRRFAQAAAYLRRAGATWPESPRPRLALMDVMLEANDWAGAEAAAREALAREARNLDALRGLGFALLRQDRNREAGEALRAALDVTEDPWARNLLDRIEKQLSEERGMTEQRLSRFNVRYDGDAHEDVGREILRLLERHYATLVRLFDHEVQAPIPVILFTQQSYHDATGAPTWSAGQYNHLDGRIRIPIGGLTASLTSDFDDVLVHELTHAFVADRSRGVAPRDIHEGLAQYMEGKRLATVTTPEQAQALADGRMQGVYAFYVGALSFVEYLMVQRGQGGMNDLLRAMGETGDLNQAFRRVYGRDYTATTQAWQQRLRQQMGS